MGIGFEAVHKFGCPHQRAAEDISYTVGGLISDGVRHFPRLLKRRVFLDHTEGELMQSVGDLYLGPVFQGLIAAADARLQMKTRPDVRRLACGPPIRDNFEIRDY